jgi:DNA polymerase/3'-5' exonuclease PolX
MALEKNSEIAGLFRRIADLWEIKGVDFKPRAYRKAAQTLEALTEDIAVIYKTGGVKALQKIPGIGISMAKKIEEQIKTGAVKDYLELQKITAIQQIIAHFFKSKGISLEKLKNDAKKEKIVYSRYTKPAKQLLELAGSIEDAARAIDKVAEWANSRALDYTIETVFKKWLELDRLKPKEIVKKPFYDGMPMVWSQTKQKWYVVNNGGEWLEFAGRESAIEWKIIK